jgi:hypothetical protein
MSDQRPFSEVLFPGARKTPVDGETAAPFFHRIAREPLLAEKDGYIVIVVDETLEDIPNWVEWDSERRVISINHMGGGVAEAIVDIKPQHLENIKKFRKILLVTNNGDEKLMHSVSFLAK